MPKVKKTKKSTTKKDPNDFSGGRERPIIYTEEKSRRCKGDKALTGEQAKELLGWEEETDDVKFGGDYLLTDMDGNKIRCHNNNTNRPFDASLAKTWQSEHLLGNWQLNGENVIVGNTGQCLDCQHRLIGFVLAVQEWYKNPDKWPYWETEPTMETFIVTGIDESDKVVNTINTGKPRSLADVLFRSPYFADLPRSDRNKVARICDYGVRILWYRTGEGADAFSPRRTHAKSIDFIDRHPKILQCVRHIHDENGRDSKLTNFISPGYAAGLLYLMGSGNTDSENYGGDNNRDEGQLEWGLYDQACDFWVLLAQGAQEMQPLRDALGNIIDEDGGSMAEKCALVIKAWNLYSIGKKMSIEKLALEYATDGDGIKTLIELPTVGGIDIGSPQSPPEPDPTPDELEERKGEEQKKRVAKKETNDKKAKAKKKTSKKKKKASPKFEPVVGDTVWVNDPDGEHYDGELLQIVGTMVRIETSTGAIIEEPLSRIQTTEPL